MRTRPSRIQNVGSGGHNMRNMRNELNDGTAEQAQHVSLRASGLSRQAVGAVRPPSGRVDTPVPASVRAPH
jgi:hypothetical protein